MVKPFSTVFEMNKFDIESVKCTLKDCKKRLPKIHKTITLRDDLGWIYRGDDKVKIGGRNPIYWIKKVSEKEYRVTLMRAEDIWLYIIHEKGMIKDLSATVPTKSHREEWDDITGATHASYGNAKKKYIEKGIIQEEQDCYISPIMSHINDCLNEEKRIWARIRSVNALKKFIHGFEAKDRYNLYEYPDLLSFLYDYIKNKQPEEYMCYLQCTFSHDDYDFNSPEQKKLFGIYETMIDVYRNCWCQILNTNKDTDWLNQNLRHKEELWELFSLGLQDICEIVRWLLMTCYGDEGNPVPENEMRVIMGKYLDPNLNPYKKFFKEVIADKRLIIDDYQYLRDYINGILDKKPGLAQECQSYEEDIDLLDKTILEMETRKQKVETVFPAPTIPEHGLKEEGEECTEERALVEGEYAEENDVNEETPQERSKPLTMEQLEIQAKLIAQNYAEISQRNRQIEELIDEWLNQLPYIDYIQEVTMDNVPSVLETLRVDEDKISSEYIPPILCHKGSYYTREELLSDEVSLINGERRYLVPEISLGINNSLRKVVYFGQALKVEADGRYQKYANERFPEIVNDYNNFKKSVQEDFERVYGINIEDIKRHEIGVELDDYLVEWLLMNPTYCERLRRIKRLLEDAKGSII